MNIQLVSSRDEFHTLLSETVALSDDSLLEALAMEAGFSSEVVSGKADILVVGVRQVSSILLQELKVLMQTRPMPVVIFTEDHSSASIQATVELGVASYVLDPIDKIRLQSVLLIARARFAETRKMKSALDKASKALEARIVIDKAKGILMQQRRISEDEAYRTLRKMAMDKNRKISDIAEQFLLAAEMLTSAPEVNNRV